jgi:hypothetical protein
VDYKQLFGQLQTAMKDYTCVVFSKGYSYQSKYQGAKHYTQFMRNAAPVENQVEYSFELNKHNKDIARPDTERQVPVRSIAQISRFICRNTGGITKRKKALE